MQPPTHMLAGMLILDIFRVIFPSSPIWLQILVVLPISFGTHYLVDIYTEITYHPSKANWNDWFYTTYHVVVYIGVAILAYFFLIEYWWTMIAANLVDIIDWVILRHIFKKGPLFHPTIYKWRDILFKNRPDWSYKRWTIIFEFLIVGILLIIILVLRIL